MNSAIERLVGLRVADLMNRGVVSISVDANMAEAAEILLKNKITGAPVIDEQGHCVGVLSSTDFASRNLSCEGHEQLEFRDDEFEIVAGNGDSPLHIEHVEIDSVRQHMTPAIQTISDQASMLEAARYMCTEHVHRLIVLDEKSHPLGVVSSLDLVAALVSAIEE